MKNFVYQLEYGTDAINEGDRILIVDDLLATGGTAKATGSLVEILGGKIVSFAFLINLVDLEGVEKLKPHHVFSIVDC